ncbi:hypothetical protein PF005_g12557 [Phytophthora fragariae]|uniref:RxLR effector protein n=1 Tax=Phytophthora fragariae TaxID=53985 RepID=A0A6A3FFD0_9STRA|nr:hypothetical protein PF003_g9414 [Phytophthora fragariae]KAE8943863.1 hypothetical protein PF009_g6448 [Phytophthora fragariae]KAE9006597.1 hypothetical protein PF011_g11510 [Phytophthora fragariae]KAE9108151.1 hypothetical protein PF010_g12017 [Phytophthora fragariae]KAE9125980.1 hypothetical protein PF007_g6150 [Phytophthora fragariae]
MLKLCSTMAFVVLITTCTSIKSSSSLLRKHTDYYPGKCQRHLVGQSNLNST